MDPTDDIAGRVQSCVRRFLDSYGRADERFTGRTNLATGLGLSSDEGLDLVLDLCEEFDYDFPGDFNPVVHESATRGNSINDLIAAVQHHLSTRRVEA